MPGSRLNVLFVGDIVGKAGRRFLSRKLPGLISRLEADFVIANGENVANGAGIKPDDASSLVEDGVDVLTSGNHIWNKKEIFAALEEGDRVLRPANYPPAAPGRGALIRESASGVSIGVINLSGRLFMEAIDCPFRTCDEILDERRGKTSIIIVDFHAEATSEKIALGWYLDGKVSAVIGTHTHVQTADERVLPGGSAYISDAGMTGSIDSVIGVKKELSLERFLTSVPQRFETAKRDPQIQGVLLEIEVLIKR